jgi:RNA polymerase sigma-70 factor (ECF subfamily)
LNNDRATQLFYDLFWPHRSAILRAARIQTANADEADDLAQETLLKAFNAIDSFRPGSNARAWLLTILRNTRIDRLRAAGPGKSFPLHNLADEPQGPPPTPDFDPAIWNDPDDLLSSFSDAEMIDALQNIPEELRWTLLLVDVEQLDHALAAGIMQIPVGTVKSRVHRGRAALRQALLPMARQRRLIRE